MGKELQAGDWREFLLWLLRRRRRFRVSGNSMLPLLKPGDEVLLDPTAYRHHPPRQGDLVVARHPYRPAVQLVKRVGAIIEDNRYFLVGDNPAESTDSRTFGPITAEHIVGRVSSRFG